VFVFVLEFVFECLLVLVGARVLLAPIFFWGEGLLMASEALGGMEDS
jgi:hypothetical protein